MLITIRFTHPYEIEGHTVAEMECRATANVLFAREAKPEVSGYCDVEVDCGRYDPAKGAWSSLWKSPDAHLRDLILARLQTGCSDDTFIDAAEATPICREPEPVDDFDADRVVHDPEYREKVRSRLKTEA